MNEVQTWRNKNTEKYIFWFEPLDASVILKLDKSYRKRSKCSSSAKNARQIKTVESRIFV